LNISVVTDRPVKNSQSNPNRSLEQPIFNPPCRASI